MGDTMQDSSNTENLEFIRMIRELTASVRSQGKTIDLIFKNVDRLESWCESELKNIEKTQGKIINSQESSIKNHTEKLKSIEHWIMEQIGILKKSINKLDAQKISSEIENQTAEMKKYQKKVNDQVDAQSKILKELETQKEKIERLVVLAENESSIPAGVIPKSARVVPDVKQDGGKLTIVFNTIVSYFVKVILYVLWGIIGLYFWIPLLFRSISIFTTNIAVSIFSQSSISSSQEGLYSAIGFYSYGFIIINNAYSKRYTNGKIPKQNLKILFWTFSKELIFSIVFYLIVLLLFSFRLSNLLNLFR